MELACHLYTATFIFLYLYASNIYKNMGKLNIMISDELENRFREAVAVEWGARGGAISKSLTEAIELWIKSRSHPVRKTEIGWSGKGEY
jgi:hypothetical protein